MSDEYHDCESTDSTESADTEVPEASSRTNEVSAFESDGHTEDNRSAEDHDRHAESAETFSKPDTSSAERTESAASKYESQSCITIDGDRFRTDDNGNIHMYYDKDVKSWKMMPNTAYESNGYKYKTDANGDIVHAEGQLHLSEGDRKPLNDKVEGITEDDDRGHIFADRFDGSNHRDNLFPQLSEENRGEYKAMENELAKAVEDGKEVTMSVELIYPENGESEHRPDEVNVVYTIDGEEFNRTFDNRRD